MSHQVETGEGAFCADLLPLYRRWLPAQVIGQLVKETKQRFYERVLPPMLVLWGFVFQRLNADHSCDAACSHLSSDRVRSALGKDESAHGEVSVSTSAYCQARGRLPLSVAQGALRATGEAFQRELGDQALWHGQRVNLLDGSFLRLRATAELQEHYGLSRNQHGANHWPQMHLVAGFDLYSGVLNGVAEGPYQRSEHALAANVLRELGAHWIHLGDRNFGVYHILQVATAMGSQVVLRLRIAQANRLGQGRCQPDLDRDVLWSPSRFDTPEANLPAPPIAGRLICVRLTRDGFPSIDLYLFTTLTDRQAFSVEELVALYGERWNVELDLRHVKTTLRMESLEAKSVDIVRKELLLGLVAYNLLRGLMGIAALRAHRSPLELSLAQCWRRVTDASLDLLPGASPEQVEGVLNRLFARLERCVLPKRKRLRLEPRAVWGRPRVYPSIKGSREEARRDLANSLNTIS